jgi:hypothetical protein
MQYVARNLDQIADMFNKFADAIDIRARAKKTKGEAQYLFREATTWRAAALILRETIIEEEKKEKTL